MTFMRTEHVEALLDDLRRFGTDTLGVEAKAARDALPSKLWRVISAFANTKGCGGGVVLLGVDESSGFAVTGVAEATRMQDALVTLCDEKMHPSLRPAISIHEIEGETVIACVIEELPTSEKPCFYLELGPTGGAYERTGDGSKRLGEYAIGRIYAEQEQPQHDRERVPSTSSADLDDKYVQLLLGFVRSEKPRYAQLDDEEVLRRLGVVDKSTGHLTLGGYLALSTEPQMEFPKLHIEARVWPTGVPGVAPDNKRFEAAPEFDGPIVVQMLDAIDWLQRRLSDSFIVNDEYRRTLDEFPRLVLREAIANALVHRDLHPSTRGEAISIDLYPDRLIIKNPGGLYGAVKKDDLGVETVHADRNAHLMRILAALPVRTRGERLVENRGSGMVTIAEELRKAHLQPPTFEDTFTHFTITIPNQSLFDQETTSWLAGVPGLGDLTDSQRVALALSKQKGRVRNAEYRSATGVDSRVATNELGDLAARELLTAHNERGGRFYTVDPRLRTDPATDDGAAGSTPDPGNEPTTDPGNEPTTEQSGEDERRAWVLDAIDRGVRVNRPYVVENLPAAPIAAKRLIEGMVADAIIRFEGATKNGGYKRVPPPEPEPTLF